jgi:hypothetical protein
MKIVNQNIFEHTHRFDAICVTTNGIIKPNGRLVMGGGVAKMFRDKYPGLDLELGKKVKVYGNIPFLIYKNKQPIISFPTKNNWRDKSELPLIKESAERLSKIASSRFWTRIALPAPGVGLGGLNWDKEVKPLLNRILDDRFYIHFYNPKRS